MCPRPNEWSHVDSDTIGLIGLRLVQGTQALQTNQTRETSRLQSTSAAG